MSPRPPGASAETPPVPWVVNETPRGWLPKLEPLQVWRHAELIGFFAQRDVKVRYKQAFLGVAWAALNPMLGALAFTILFNRWAEVDVGGTPYFPFALAGFVAWNYFSASFGSGTSSLLVNGELLTKVAFPRIVAPVATLLPPMIDLAIGLVLTVVVGVIAGAGFSFVQLVVCLPLGLVLLVASVVGPVLVLSAMVVRFRDVSTIAGFGLQFLLLASPVAYPPSLVPEAWQTVYYLNPLAGALGLIRAALLGMPAPGIAELALSFAVAAVALVAGLVYFRRHERYFADVI